ncbi:MAG TPA: peroxiredoxin [Nannocystis exedens]|nr:peroxiredoxin [Nannocystis exedens]
MLSVGERAPDFTLPDQDGAEVSIAALREQGCVVVYFYPKDNTPGCTAQACSFRDSFADFQEAGAQVLGISSDSVASHRAFSSKHNLPFRILADPKGQVRAAFGVPKTLGLLDGRVTFVIDRDNVIRHTFSSQLRARKHIGEALKVVRRLIG